MGKVITIDPITRISGFLEISAEVENNIVIRAKTSGMLFRGFEKMLRGRAPLDAIYFTERICGICSTAHAMASTLALENALNIAVDENDRILRDIIHGFEFIQNHIRQFYLFIVPSYVKLKDINPLNNEEHRDLRLPDDLNSRISQGYFKAAELSSLAHEGLAVLGGKAPHNHGIFAGGVTIDLDSYKLSKIKAIIKELKLFVSQHMLEDTNIIAHYYSDYYRKGISYQNFMSFGVSDYVKPSVSINGIISPLEPDKITENIKYSWYIGEQAVARPGKENYDEVNIKKSEAYTFVKAPRYNGVPVEVGPLARMKLSGEYSGGGSAMDRIMARTLETKKILDIMENLADKVQIKPNAQGIYEIPEKAFGAGLVDTTRGALGHWVEIENKVIKFYDIITPTAWNLSPMDSMGLPGAGEKALMGTSITDIDNPIELGRIIRTFDPCISCATHVISKGNKIKEIRIL